MLAYWPLLPEATDFHCSLQGLSSPVLASLCLSHACGCQEGTHLTKCRVNGVSPGSGDSVTLVSASSEVTSVCHFYISGKSRFCR